MIKYYRKRPVVIRAIQLTENNFNECINFITETSTVIYKPFDQNFDNKIGIETLKSFFEHYDSNKQIEMEEALNRYYKQGPWRD